MPYSKVNFGTDSSRTLSSVTDTRAAMSWRCCRSRLPGIDFPPVKHHRQDSLSMAISCRLCLDVNPVFPMLRWSMLPVCPVLVGLPPVEVVHQTRLLPMVVILENNLSSKSRGDHPLVVVVLRRIPTGLVILLSTSQVGSRHRIQVLQSSKRFEK